MPAQISPSADAKINGISRRIGQNDVVIEEATRDNKLAWEQFEETLHEFNKPDTRFLADDGEYMVLSLRKGKVELDPGVLSQKLQAMKDTNAQFRALWNAITVRTVDFTLLEQARIAGKIPQSVLDECITQKPDTVAHLRQPWAKDDKTRAQVLGITVTERSDGPMVSITKAEYERLQAAAGVTAQA